MKKIPDSLSPQQAWERLQTAVPLPIELRSITDALGLFLTTPVIATEDVPPGPRSFMDGYAVQSSDVSNVPAQLAVQPEILMGKAPSRSLSAGQAMPIPTGGFLPDGADAVVMQEDTEVHDDSIMIRRSGKSGENVQQQGEDFRKGAPVFTAGHRLRPQDISTLATFGVQEVSVIRKARVHILSTGNELVPFTNGSKTREQIRESNSLALAGACSLFQFPCSMGGIVHDDFASQRKAVEAAMISSDVILISGGSSVGERDFTIDVIQSFSPHEIHFHGIAIRPGNPTIFASAGSTWIFGVPGQPVSSLIVFYLYILPFLFHISGEKVGYDQFPYAKFPHTTAALDGPVQPLKHKTDYLRVKLKVESGRRLAIPVLGKSASLSTLTSADGFTIIPPGDAPIEAGSAVDVFLFP